MNVLTDILATAGTSHALDHQKDEVAVRTMSRPTLLPLPLPPPRILSHRSSGAALKLKRH